MVDSTLMYVVVLFNTFQNNYFSLLKNQYQIFKYIILTTQAIFVQQTRTFTIILLILIVILVELAPEIIVSISTTKIRKFWSCLFLGSMIIYFILKAIIGNTLKTNKIYHFILLELQHLRYFGKYKDMLLIHY